jgi:protein-tyrosine phosphatase
MSKRLLFLCTGNYYRSRFAEMLFNHLAANRGLVWTAESRGLATETNHLLPGVISPLTCAALAARGVPMPAEHRDAIQCCDDDFAGVHRVIALNEIEHRPLVLARFPAHVERIEYWQIDDINISPAESAILELDRKVRRLINELAADAG